MLLWFTACTADPTTRSTDDTPGSDTATTTDETATTPTRTGDTGDTGVRVTADTGPPPGPTEGVLVLAGGGSEGEVGDDLAWSARLYRELLAGGDVSGDGLVTVAILSDAPQTPWLADYFVGLGADAAFDVLLDDRAAADDPALSALLADVDAFFLKGGDQGVYYDRWNDRRIEDEVRRVRSAGGGVGGTSAGAMSLAGVALAGGEDLISSDVLADACTPYLDDASDGGSGLHEDFLGFLPGAIVDTHTTVRGRLGRMVGTLAKAVDDGTSAGWVVGLDERTGLVVRDGVATVVGVGAVTLVVPGDAPPERTCGAPLAWTDLRLDALIDGWSFELATLRVIPGPGAEAVAWDGIATANGAGAWYVDGDLPRHEERFAAVVDRAPEAYGLHPGSDRPVLADGVGVLDAHDSERRGPAQEAVFRAVAERVGWTGYVVGKGAGLDRDESRPDLVRFVDNPIRLAPQEATLVLVSTGVTARGTSPELSNLDVDGTLRAAGVAGLVLHVLADTPDTGLAFDGHDRVVVRGR